MENTINPLLWSGFVGIVMLSYIKKNAILIEKIGIFSCNFINTLDITEKELNLAEMNQQDADNFLLKEIEGVDKKCAEYHEEDKKEISELIEEIKKEPPVDAKVERVAMKLASKLAVLEKGEKGDKGDRGEQGKTGKDGKNGRDGKDGIDGINGIDGTNGKDGKNGKDGASDTGIQIIEKINSAEGKINLERIEGVDLLKDEINGKIQGVATKFAAARKMTGSAFSFSGNGSTTQFYLPKEPAGKGMFIFAHYQGQWLQKDVHYSIKGKLFDTAGGTNTFTAASGTTIEGFLINF